jgi:hypothetical protein
LQSFSKIEGKLLAEFIHHFPEVKCNSLEDMADIEILLKKIGSEADDNRKIRSSMNQVLTVKPPLENNFFLYEDNPAITQKLFYHSFEKSTIWHLTHNHICLHSAACSSPINSGFLILGDSGVGKSTFGQFCKEEQHHVLGDDANFVIRTPGDGYQLHYSPTINKRPYPYSRMTPALSRIFVLKQDTADFLESLSVKTIAARLYRSFNELYTNHGIPVAYQQKAFEICCNIARQVPGYELHFTKSTRFLEVIRAAFPEDFD